MISKMLQPGKQRLGLLLALVIVVLVGSRVWQSTMLADQGRQALQLSLSNQNESVMAEEYREGLAGSIPLSSFDSLFSNGKVFYYNNAAIRFESQAIIFSLENETYKQVSSSISCIDEMMP